MLDKTHTGNRVDEPDFLKVLLTLKRNIMQDTNVAEVCKVLEINNDVYTVSPINNSNVRLKCYKLASLDPKKDDLVLVIFTNTDYRLNLNKINNNKPTQTITDELLHSLNYGVITGSVSNSGSTDVGTKVTVGGIFQLTYEMNNKANVSDIPTKTSQLINDSGYITSSLVDSVLSTTSENPVQNKVITEALNNKTTVNISNVAQDSIDFTSDPQTQIDNITGDISTLQNQIDDINDNSWTLFLHQPLSTVSGVSSVNITNVFNFDDYDYKIEYSWTPDKWAAYGVKLRFLNSLNNIITFTHNSWIRTTLNANYNSGQEGSFTPSGYAKCGYNDTIVNWGLDASAGKGPVVYNGEFIAGYDCDGNRVINYNTLSSRASFWCQQQYQYSGTLDISDSLIGDGITGLNLYNDENISLLANKSYIKLYRRKGGWNNNF